MPDITTFHSSEENLPEERLASLDMFRGLVLFLLLLESARYGWQHHLAEAYPDSWLVRFIEFQVSHVAWRGCSFWDLIQPAFMFMVGISMAFSFARRVGLGQGQVELLTHALIRAVILILLGVFLRSLDSPRTNWAFDDVLSQIGLGYFFLALLWGRWWRIQAVVGFAVLFVYWLLFVIQAVPETVDWTIAEGQGWREPLTGFAAHWNKNVNFAHSFDTWFLNGFSREEPFVANPGGYVTLNFVPAFVTMLIGLLTGEYLREEDRSWAVPKVLAFCGAAAIVIGILLDFWGLCPLVKRTWTPAFTIYSAGWILVVLSVIYAAVELFGWSGLAYPFRVLGMNSILVYVMGRAFAPWVNGRLQVHLGENYGAVFGEAFRPLVENLVVLFIIWLIAWWMYRRRIFVRI